MSFEARFATIGEAYGASLTDVADPEKQALEEARVAADARQSDFCVTDEAERVAKLEDEQADEALKMATKMKEETQRGLIEARAAKKAAADAATKARAEQKDAAAKALSLSLLQRGRGSVCCPWPGQGRDRAGAWVGGAPLENYRRKQSMAQ
eukprot:gene23199-30414_t